MRSRHVTVMADEITGSARRPRWSELFALLILMCAAAWISYAFAQQAYLDHRLLDEESSLRQQNAELRAQNDRYNKDIGAVVSGAAAEENARRGGYSRPNEKIFVVTQPSPDAVPSKPVTKADDGQGDLWTAITRWLGTHLPHQT
jgi:cell division protein FtsB